LDKPIPLFGKAGCHGKTSATWQYLLVMASTGLPAIAIDEKIVNNRCDVCSSSDLKIDG